MCYLEHFSAYGPFLATSLILIAFISLQEIPSSNDKTEDGILDVSFMSQSADDSMYLPTPIRIVRETIKNVVIVPSKVCFMDLTQLDKFMKQLNEVRVCVPHLVVRAS